MASAASAAGARRRARLGAQGDVRRVTPAEIAWIAAIPCALVAVLAVLVAGPPLGRALLSPDPARDTFWPFLPIAPQPLEHGRFLAAFAGPLLLAALVLVSASPRMRDRVRLPSSAIAGLTAASQLALLAFVAFCFLAQFNLVGSADYYLPEHRDVFTRRTLLIAAAVPLLAWALLSRARVRAQLRRLTRETRARRVACLLAASAYVALWMLIAVNLDRSIGNTNGAVGGHLLWTMGEAFAVLDGRTPLVDFHAQYGQVWAYVSAAAMVLFGTTVGTYSIAMATGSALALLAVYATLRRVVRSSVAALVLFAPFLATTGFMAVGPLENRYSSLNLYILWPIRFAGPFVLAWLVARHVDRARPRHAWLLFAAGGLVALNNLDFGAAACAATLAALAAARPPTSRHAVVRLIAQAALGLTSAVAACALLTLLSAGSLPHFGLLLEFGRLYAVAGWSQVPMPVLGLHVAVFLTFAGALVVAAVRVAQSADDRLLTGMLAWAGTFGLGSSVYYVARAHTMALFHFFGPWAFAIALLLVAVARDLSARGWRHPAPAQLAVLFAFGLMLCSLAQTPAPGAQLHRLEARTFELEFKQPDVVQLLQATTHRGERVGVLTPLSHRVAYDAGVVNVSPYTSIESMPTQQQLARLIATMRAAGARKLYVLVAPAFTPPEALAAIEAAGFVRRRASRARSALELIDAHGG
jgi:hypothetical protein